MQKYSSTEGLKFFLPGNLGKDHTSRYVVIWTWGELAVTSRSQEWCVCNFFCSCYKMQVFLSFFLVYVCVCVLYYMNPDTYTYFPVLPLLSDLSLLVFISYCVLTTSSSLPVMTHCGIFRLYSSLVIHFIHPVSHMNYNHLYIHPQTCNHTHAGAHKHTLRFWAMGRSFPEYLTYFKLKLGI